MKVGLFIDSYHPKINGVITSVDTLKEGLENLGHEVLIITGGTNIEMKKKNEIIELPSIYLTPWNTRVISPYSSKNKEVIRKEKFDIVHSHTPFFTGLLATSIAKEEKIPNIHSYHTFCEKYKDYVLHNFAHSGDFIVNSINNIFCGKNIDGLIVPSEELKEYLQETGKTNQEITVIPTGIILKNFTNNNPKSIEERHTKYGISDKDFVLMYAGRLGKEKNISFIIENHKEIIKLNDNIKLLMVGDGPEYTREKKKMREKNETIF